ncbi:MAG: hypothetical protein BWZ02_01543 [Lentisphaerae bacterium ADurb.BinA184]|nr:MAG: hypothetical protein BWZ02_01543 [Lentisphaerae bacterium ADurb.BinA184]
MNRALSILVAVLAFATVSAFAAPGDIIVRDEFTGAGTAPTVVPPGGPYDLWGRIPDTANLPGGTWVGNLGWSYGIYNNVAWGNADITITKSIASAGGYVKPSLIAISADVNLGWTDPVTQGAGLGGSGYGSGRGVGVGFFAGGLFTGVTVGADGSLNILDSSYWYSPTWIANLPWAGGGSFDPSAWHSLAYTIDTSSGAITSLTFDGTPYSVTTTAFLDADTDQAGFYMNSWSGNNYGYVDNFQVMEEVPEPSTLACVAMAGLLALRRRRG